MRNYLQMYSSLYVESKSKFISKLDKENYVNKIMGSNTCLDLTLLEDDIRSELNNNFRVIVILEKAYEQNKYGLVISYTAELYNTDESTKLSNSRLQYIKSTVKSMINQYIIYAEMSIFGEKVDDIVYKKSTCKIRQLYADYGDNEPNCSQDWMDASDWC